MMKRFLVFGAVVVTSGLGLGAYMYREVYISGDELKQEMLKHNSNSYASWDLYFQDDKTYCLKLSKPIIPKRFCIPKSDIQIRKMDASDRYVRQGEVFLREGRTPGAKEEVL